MIRYVRATTITALLFTVGIADPPSPQKHERREERGRQGEPKGRGPAPRARESNPQVERERSQERQERRPAAAPARQQAQQARQQDQRIRDDQRVAAWQQSRGWAGRDAWPARETWQQTRAQRWDRDHRSWAQRGGYGGYQIPQANFGRSFGSEHRFRMYARPTIYMGYPRFVYSGFSFLIVDPWPEYWAENWYESDDVYIDYEDGYYLHSYRYPYVRLAITVIR